MVVIGRMVLPVLMGIVLGGCVIIPTPSHGGVGVITAKTIESFEPGKTTRADVLLGLGNPAERLEDDRFFVYRWKRLDGYFVVGVLPWGTSIRRHYLGLEFTPDNHLKRAKMFDRWRSDDSHHNLAEWMAEKPESPNQ